MSAFPFSYLRSDSPAVNPGSYPVFSHPPHTGFLKAPEYRRPTIKLSSSIGEADVEVLRQIQEELEQRIARVGVNALESGKDGDDGSGGKQRSGGKGRRLHRREKKLEESGGVVPMKRPRFEKNDDSHRLIGAASDSDHPRFRAKVNSSTPPGVEGQGRIFHTSASRSVHDRPADVDSGCQSDASESRTARLAQQRDLVHRPVSLEHPGILDNFLLKSRSTTETTTNHGRSPLPVSHNQLPVSSNQLPVSHNQLPVSSNHLPVSHHQLPVNRNQLLVSHNPFPVSHSPQAVGYNHNQHPVQHNRKPAGLPRSLSSEDYLKPIPHAAEPRPETRWKNHQNRKSPLSVNPSNGHAARKRRDPGPHINPSPAHAQRLDARDVNRFTSRTTTEQIFVPAATANASFSTETNLTNFVGSEESLMTTFPRSSGHSSRSCSRNSIIVVFLLVLMLLIGFGTGFAAGWFGNQASRT